jgi:hypothetical protein
VKVKSGAVLPDHGLKAASHVWADLMISSRFELFVAAISDCSTGFDLTGSDLTGFYSAGCLLIIAKTAPVVIKPIATTIKIHSLFVMFVCSAIFYVSDGNIIHFYK